MKLLIRYAFYVLFIIALHISVYAEGKIDILKWMESPTDLNGDGVINALDVFVAANQYHAGMSLFPLPTPTPNPRIENLPDVGAVLEIAVQNESVIPLDFPTGDEAYLIVVRNESFTQSSIVALEANSPPFSGFGYRPKIDLNHLHIHEKGCCLNPEIITYPERYPYTPSQFQQLNVGQKKTFQVYPNASVSATLRYLGRHAAIYVDDAIWQQGELAITQEMVNREGVFFDETTFPVITSVFGVPGDVNNDGHIGILISTAAAEPGGAGFFFGGDLFRRNELAPSFPTNTMELLYIAPPNTPGANVDEEDLAPIIAHELQHLINFYYHSLVHGGRNGQNDEERWLDEGLSHLAEDFISDGRSNITRRGQFIAETDVQGIFVDNVYPGGAQRGGSYLLCRYLVDRFGEGIIPKLVQTAKKGLVNIESAVGMSIQNLLRDWSRALFVSNMNINQASEYNYRFFSEHSSADGRDWGRPKFVDFDLSNLQFFGALYYSPIAPGGFGYAVMRSRVGGIHEIKVSVDAGVLPVIDVIRLPNQFVYYDFIDTNAWVSSERDSVILDEPLLDIFVVGEPRTVRGFSSNNTPLDLMQVFLRRNSGGFNSQRLLDAKVDGDRFEAEILFENVSDAGEWNLGFLPNANRTTIVQKIQVVLP